MYDGTFIDGSLSNVRQPPSPETVLSGTQDILEEGTKQLVANFALHSLDKMVHGSG